MTLRANPVFDVLRRGAPGAALLLAALGIEVAAHAESGRFCGEAVESGWASGATQEEAVAAAQSWWSSRAGPMGRGYQNWDVAADRAVECKKAPDGTFECKAIARPCLPPGTLPENVPKIEM